MTIDSFCAELIRQNAERLGINPAYRVAETAEALILERSVCEALIDSAFRGEIEGISPAEFEKLCDALTGVKNTSALADVFIALFEKTKSMVKGTDIFFDFANDYLQYSTKSLDFTYFVERSTSYIYIQTRVFGYEATSLSPFLMILGTRNKRLCFSL